MIAASVSFKEETTVVGDLPETQKKALEELKKLVRDALNKHEFIPLVILPPPQTEEFESAVVVEAEKEEKKDEEEKEEAVELTETEKAEVEGSPVPVVTAAAVDDDDGAKTVEAIEETIFAVSPTEPEKKTENEESTEKMAGMVEEEKKESEAECHGIMDSIPVRHLSYSTLRLNSAYSPRKG